MRTPQYTVHPIKLEPRLWLSHGIKFIEDGNLTEAFHVLEVSSKRKYTLGDDKVWKTGGVIALDSLRKARLVREFMPSTTKAKFRRAEVCRHWVTTPEGERVRQRVLDIVYPEKRDDTQDFVMAFEMQQAVQEEYETLQRGIGK
jgi:hypothetical protein